MQAMRTHQQYRPPVFQNVQTEEYRRLFQQLQVLGIMRAQANNTSILNTKIFSIK